MWSEKHAATFFSTLRQHEFTASGGNESRNRRRPAFVHSELSSKQAIFIDGQRVDRLGGS
jgi:hypothetical protein